MSKTYTITIEGQSIPVPEEIGSDDAKVRAALAPYFPDAANALITRSEKEDKVTVNVVKKAGSKGGEENPILTSLRSADPGQNPAVELYLKIGSEELDPIHLLEIGADIDRAMEDGKVQGAQLETAVKSLRNAAPTPAPVVMIGF